MVRRYSDDGIGERDAYDALRDMTSEQRKKYYSLGFDDLVDSEGNLIPLSRSSGLSGLLIAGGIVLLGVGVIYGASYVRDNHSQDLNPAAQTDSLDTRAAESDTLGTIRP